MVYPTTKKPPQVIHPSGQIFEAPPPDGADDNPNVYSLSQLQGIVGGYIEVITTPSGLEMVLNEEGKLNGLPLNEKATMMSGLWPRDVIVGSVLLCEPSYLG